MAEHTCRQCGSNFEVLTRGRPPVKCNSCKNSDPSLSTQGEEENKLKGLVVSDDLEVVPELKPIILGTSHFKHARFTEEVGVSNRTQQHLLGGVTYAQIQRVIGEWEDVRKCVMVRFKESGGDLNRWEVRDKIRMADALTFAEDDLELIHPRLNDQRRSMRKIRRKLEMDL